MEKHRPSLSLQAHIAIAFHLGDEIYQA